MARPDPLPKLRAASVLASRLHATAAELRRMLVQAEIARRELDAPENPPAWGKEAAAAGETLRQTAALAVDSQILLRRYRVSVDPAVRQPRVFANLDEVHKAMADGSPNLERDLVATLVSIWGGTPAASCPEEPAAAPPVLAKRGGAPESSPARRPDQLV